MTPPLLDVDALEVTYHTPNGPLAALEDVSLQVHPGEIVGIVGESGCGKSTLASAVTRLLGANASITAGQVRFRGEDLGRYDEEGMRRLWGTDMSMIFQDPGTSLNPLLTIEDQLLTPLKQRPDMRGLSRQALRARMIEVLERVGIPDPEQRVRSYPHEFSGGMRQRVMIAMALLSNPSLLVADEPTSALDVTLSAQINDLLLGLRDELGTSILYITHDLGIIAEVCDRVVVMYAGQVVESGSVVDVFADPRHPYTRALLAASPSALEAVESLATIPGQVPSLADMPRGCRFADRCRFAQDVCRGDAPALLDLDGRKVRCKAYEPEWAGPRPETGSPRSSEPTAQAALSPAELAEERESMVEIRDLRVHFRERSTLLHKVLGRRPRSVRAVDGVDLHVGKGEIVALVGESGSGKTTLGRSVLRLLDENEGSIAVAGREVGTLSRTELRPFRAEMQMIFQDAVASLSPRLRVSALLREPFAIHGVPLPDAESRVKELLTMVGLSETHAEKYPHELSGGQARRVGIARALALEPRVLVADEPTAGLDVSVGAGILNLLRDLSKRLDLSLILITHDLNIIRYMAHRIAVMYLGRIVETGATEELLAAPRHPYTEALLSAVSIPDPLARSSQHRIVLQGEPPSPSDPPPGCPFHPRCRYAESRCSIDEPPLSTIDGSLRKTACHFPERVGSLHAKTATTSTDKE